MNGRGTTVAAGVLGVVGLALLVFESVRAMTGSSFNTLASILLYGGLGLVVVSGLMLIVAAFAASASPARG